MTSGTRSSWPGMPSIVAPKGLTSQRSASSSSASASTSPRRHCADDPPGHAGPRGRVGDPAAVDQRAHAREVGGGELPVLGVVGLDDGGVDRVAEVVRREAERVELLVGVERVVHDDLAPAAAQRLDGGEDARRTPSP